MTMAAYRAVSTSGRLFFFRRRLSGVELRSEPIFLTKRAAEAAEAMACQEFLLSGVTPQMRLAQAVARHKELQKQALEQ